MTSSEKPLLLVDIDGVLNPYAAAHCPDGFTEHELFPDADLVRLCKEHGGWMRDLAEQFDLVWVAEWAEDPNALLGPLLGIDPLPRVPAPERRFDGATKLVAVSEYVGADRAVAWIDDVFDEATHAWAEARRGPTLLVEVDPAVGWHKIHVARLIEWAAILRRAPG